jgi:hypothetical protein
MSREPLDSVKSAGTHNDRIGHPRTGLSEDPRGDQVFGHRTRETVGVHAGKLQIQYRLLNQGLGFCGSLERRNASPFR